MENGKLSGVFFLQCYKVREIFSHRRIYYFSRLAETFNYRVKSFRTLTLISASTLRFSRSLLITYLLTLDSGKKNYCF